MKNDMVFNKVGGVKGYYSTVEALTIKEGQSVDVDNSLLAERTGLSWLAAPVIVFFVIFAAGFGTMISTKTRDFKRFLVVLAAALTSAVIPLSMQVVTKDTEVQIKAGPELMPKNIIVNNVNSSSFVVSWDTDKPVKTVVRIGTDSTGVDFIRPVFNVDGELEVKHRIVVDKLMPNTDYYFEILSETLWFDNNGKPLHVKTLP